MRRVFFGLAVLQLATLCSEARAQPIPVGDPATQGVANPSLGLTSEADASAVDKNPALLGNLRSWSGVYLHSELAGDGPVGGRGDGFFFAAPVPYLSSLAVGVGVQLVRPPDAFPFGDLTKISLAFAWRLHPTISFGLSYAHLASNRAPIAPGVDTLDLALAGRFGRHLAWALVVRDVPGPTVGGIPLQRVYDPELAFRPLGTDRLELAVGARFGERRGDVDPHFRLWAVAHRGIVVKADVEWRRDLDLDGRPEDDVRVALGLQLDLERVGIAGFGLFGRDNGRTSGHGFALAARVSGERYPTFFAGPAYLERIELTKELRGHKLIELLARLRDLETDTRAAGVVLLGGELGAGFAAAEELRAALLRLRHRGRRVLAFLVHADTKGYLVASAAERIVMDPAGDLALVGPSTTAPYFKGTGELLGVHADYVRIGAYKSAPERYTREGPSPEARASRETYLDDLYRHLLDALAESRRLPAATVRSLIDRGPLTPMAARRAALIDEVRPGEEISTVIEALTGARLPIGDAPRAPARPEAWSAPEIAVIELEGDLIGGASRSIPLLGLRATGLHELVAALERALDDTKVRAIVLRIDSPGGSSIAADLLAREIARVRAHKPVVCSLGDVAASGGYYVASMCDEVLAAPSTLTGSIGIFTGKLDLSGLAAKLGVSLTRLERGAHASIDSLFRAYTEEERDALRTLLRYHYDRFVATVAQGRRMSESRVDDLGQGRIYSGDRARALGLVDHYGGLADAIDAAARRAEVPRSTPIRLMSATPTVLGQLSRLLGLRLPGLRAASGWTGLAAIDDLAALLPSSLCFEPSVPQARLDVGD